MKIILYTLILFTAINLCYSQDKEIKLHHQNKVDCRDDPTNPQCMDLWDILETLS